jgi:hypothetical protein
LGFTTTSANDVELGVLAVEELVLEVELLVEDV